MKAISCWLFLIGLTVSLVAASSWAAGVLPANAAKAAIERGNSLLDKEDYPAAIQAFNEALRLDRKSVPAYIGRGTCLRMLDKFDEALADFNEALRLEPKNSEAHRGRGVVFGMKKDFGKAFAECDEAIRCDPNNGAAYRSRGGVHAEKGESDQAIADYNRAIRLNPKDGWAFYDRAFEDSKKGEIEKAIADFSEAIRIKPADYDAIYNRGDTYRNNGEFDKAIADFSAAVRLKPRKPEPFSARAYVFLLKDDLDHAISDLEEVLRLNPQCRAAYQLLGSAYAAKGDYDKAIADLTNAIQIDAKDYVAYCLRGVVYVTKGDLEKARADFDKSVVINGKYVFAYRCRGAIYVKNEMLDEAIADYSHAIQLEPKQFSDYRVRGSIYEKKGDTQKAEDDFALARQLGLKSVLEERGLAKTPVPQAAIDSVRTHVREEVKRLEYSEAVAQELLAMVHDWNLAALEQKLAAARDEQRRGKLSKDKLAQAEREIAESLCREIEAVVRYKKEVFELDEAIRSKSGCCVSYALMFDVLGRSIGLDVQGLDVPVVASGHTVDDQGHMACLIHLADGKVAIVDATGSLGRGALVSKPFQFAETYREKVSYWELKDAPNQLGLHPLVLPLDNNGFVADILLCRATTLRAKGNLKLGECMAAEAIRRNPRSGAAYEDQGMIHEDSGDHDRAIADFSAAIKHNPLRATAYLGRGRSYIAMGQIDRGLADFDDAIRLNPKFAVAYAARGWVHASQAERDKAYVAWANGNTTNSPYFAKKSDTSSSKDCIPDRAAADKTDEDKVNSFVMDKKLGGMLRSLDWVDHDNNPRLPPENKEPSQPNPGDVQASRDREEEYNSKIKHEQKQALADFDEAIRLDPKVSWYYKLRGAVYETRGEIDKALADLSEVIRLDPTSAEAFERRADLYAQKHDIEKAAVDYAQAARLRPEDDRYR